MPSMWQGLPGGEGLALPGLALAHSQSACVYCGHDYSWGHSLLVWDMRAVSLCPLCCKVTRLCPAWEGRTCLGCPKSDFLVLLQK